MSDPCESTCYVKIRDRARSFRQLSNDDDSRVASRFPGRSDQMINRVVYDITGFGYDIGGNI